MAYKKEPIDAAVLHLKLNESRTARYLVSRNGAVSKVNDSDFTLPSGNLAIISYTGDDYFTKVSSKVNDKKANQVLLEAVEAPTNSKVINHSGNGFLYSTPGSRHELTDESYKSGVYPLMELANISLSGKNKKVDITGFLLGKENDVLILIGFEDDGRPSFSVSSDVDDIKSQMDIFAMSSKIKDDYEYLIFDQDELFLALDEALPYPNFNAYYGIPENTFWSGVSALSILGVAVIGSLYLYQSNKISSLQIEIDNLKQETMQISNQVADIASKHIPDIVAKSTINYQDFFTNAESLWVENSVIASETNKLNESHTIKLMINEKSLTLDSHIKDFLNIAPPKNCVIEKTTIGMSLNEITAKYNCKSPSSNFSSFGF
jgi:hypothetical protein